MTETQVSVFTDTLVRTVPTSTIDSDEPDQDGEFDRFKDLAAKLFQVPGREIREGEG